MHLTESGFPLLGDPLYPDGGRVNNLADPRLNRVKVDFDEDAQWIIVHRGSFDVLANLADCPQLLPSASGKVLFSTEPWTYGEDLRITLPAWSACIIRVTESRQP